MPHIVSTNFGIGPCSSEETPITIVGQAPYSVYTPVNPSTGPSLLDKGYAYAPVTYTLCLPTSTIAKLIPAPVTPTASDGSGVLTAVVVCALIAQLAINAIALRRPTRAKAER